MFDTLSTRLQDAFKTLRGHARLTPDNIESALREIRLALLEADDEQVGTLVKLRETGVQVALDDFGTSYSSLSHLRRFPVDVVKIDRSFVKGLRIDEQDSAIVRAVVGLSETFRFRVIAEGVETVGQLDEQRVLGCHGAQGFLIGEELVWLALLGDDLVGHGGGKRSVGTELDLVLGLKGLHNAGFDGFVDHIRRVYHGATRAA